MKFSGKTLAWSSGIDSEEFYTAKDLGQTDKIKKIFAACKDSQGYITAEGWEFLFSMWDLKELLELDLETKWFHSGTAEESSAHLIYQSLMAGYNPICREKGDYESDSGLFISLEGKKSHVNWDKILKNQ